jgi:putative transposase
MALKSWVDNWEHLSTFFKFSPGIRRIIYTTNPIEGLHRQVRKYTKSKAAFTSENALFKQIYCAIINIINKWNQPYQNWSATISELDIHFPNRIVC